MVVSSIRAGVDPRLQVAMGLGVNALIFSRETTTSGIVLVFVVAVWLSIGRPSRRSLLFWLVIQTVILLVFGVSFLFGLSNPSDVAQGVLRWSAGCVGGVMIAVWPGIENLARVLLATPIPKVLTMGLALGLRALPAFSEAATNHHRWVLTLSRVGFSEPRRHALRRGISAVLSESIESIDNIVKQIELRGFHATMFGNLTRLVWSSANVISAAAACLPTAVVLTQILIGSE